MLHLSVSGAKYPGVPHKSAFQMVKSLLFYKKKKQIQRTEKLFIVQQNFSESEIGYFHIETIVQQNVFRF